MKPLHSRLVCALAGCLVVLFGAAPATADDSEVFTSATFTSDPSARPNVLFIIDTSGSMDGDVTSYDPSVTYTDGPCDTGKIYWQTANDDKPPDCSTNRFVTTAANKCRTAYLGMASNGWWRGQVQQLKGNNGPWQDTVAGQKDLFIECAKDAGNHGNLDASVPGSGTNLYARNGSEAGIGRRWGPKNDASNVNWNGKQTLSLYSGNYGNYWYGTGPKAHKTRLEIVRDVAKSLVDTLGNVNLGLMRYSNNQGSGDAAAEGGMITYPISELTPTSRAAMKTQLDSYLPDGFTPLSETLYEAEQYLAGRNVKYGDSSKLNSTTPFLSVAGSRVGGVIGSKQYESPMDSACQKTFIVYLTDGLPTADTSADSDIQGLPNFATDGFVPTDKGGGGDKCPAKGPDGTANGRCMVNLAGYMANHDMRSDIKGEQTVTTYVVGFGDDIAGSKDFLDDVAAAGGGKAYTQKDAAGLTATLEEIFSEVALDANSSFVSPTVAVNAFNRTRNLNSLFVSVFAPTKKLHWPGNVKKYQLIDGVIYGDNTSTPAVGDKGFFADGVKDMFSADSDPDGPIVTLGGAASRIPAGASRNVYTYLDSNNDLTVAANQVIDSNATVTATLLGLGSSSTAADRTRIINFVHGLDVVKDATSTKPRHAMGDPMRTRPAVAIYGGTETAPIGTVFSTTNDGYLHAFNMTTGDEKWAFIPKEFLPKQSQLFDDGPSAVRRYAIDGDVRIFKYDVNGDGIVNGDDKVYAVFGFGRGGAVYYALDVTNVEKPRFLWKKTNVDLPKLGQAWSPPVFTRVNVGGGGQTDPQKIVAIFGGGYDEAQENYTYTRDGVGNAIYMLELTTGNLLWSASRTGANFNNTNMNNAIPGEVTVIDMDGDSYGDRMYVGDMGGRLWRFDIWHGEAPATLVSGGILANLGAGALSSPTLADTRRFYYAPDVSVVTPRGSAPFMNIAIGSGYRGHPLESDNQDRFYSVRDYQPFVRRLNSSYAAGVWTPITDGDLVDVTGDVQTPVADGKPGWKLTLNLNGWRGEKVLAESITANGVIFFPTFTPLAADEDNPCLARTLNRAYAVYLDSAKPFGLRDGEKPGDDPPVDKPEDRFIDLAQGGIAPGMAVIQTPDNKTLCLEGVEAIGRCVDLGDVVRTFWERKQ